MYLSCVFNSCSFFTRFSVKTLAMVIFNRLICQRWNTSNKIEGHGKCSVRVTNGWVHINGKKIGHVRLHIYQ